MIRLRHTFFALMIWLAGLLAPASHLWHHESAGRAADVRSHGDCEECQRGRLAPQWQRDCNPEGCGDPHHHHHGAVPSDDCVLCAKVLQRHLWIDASAPGGFDAARRRALRPAAGDRVVVLLPPSSLSARGPPRAFPG